MDHWMDHRLGSRCLADVPVVVEIGGSRVLTGRLRDISEDGVFVELPGVELRGDTLVRMRFTAPGPGGPGRFTWKGVVVRRAPDGIGAMFCSDDTEDIQGLQALLRSVRRTSAGGLQDAS